MGIQIIVADDHKVMREGLRSLLEKQGDFEVVAEAEDGRTAVRLAGELEPDIIIMDVAMPDLNGIEATRQIINDSPDMKVVALSMYPDKRFVAEMLKAGASGYLLKNCAFKELVNAIRIVTDNQIYLSPRIAGVVVGDYVGQLSKKGSSAFSALTDREREVLQLLAEGKSTKQIASRLNLSTKTIDSHRQQIMKKLSIRSVAELTKYAVREGLTSLET